MKTLIGISVIVVCMLSPRAAGAMITTMHLDSDVQLVELLSDTMFVSEGRIGDLGDLRRSSSISDNRQAHPPRPPIMHGRTAPSSRSP